MPHDRDGPHTTRRGRAALLLAALVLLLLQACSNTQTRALPLLTGPDSSFIDDPVFDGRIHVYTAGDPADPPVLLVHGIDDRGAASWEGVIAELARDYYVIAPDLPGFGHSGVGNEHYTPDRYVDSLAAVIAAYAEGPVHLVGHSLGGAVGIRYAATYPGDVEHLHLASVAGILHKSTYSRFLAGRGGEAAAAFDHEERLFDRLGGRFLSKLFRRLEERRDVSATARDRARFLNAEPGRIAGVALLETDFSATLTEVSTPTSILWGSDDRVAPLRTARLLAATLPGRDLTLFSGVGHMPMEEIPGEFAAALRERIAGTGAGGDAWPPPSRVPGDRVGRCKDERDRVFSGRYDRIEIDNCGGVVLDRVSARSVEIVRSRVTVREPQIHGDAFGLRVRGSDVVITAGDISGDVAIDVTQTFLDVAGTRLNGRDVAVYASGRGGSELTFSVTPYRSGDEQRFIHTIRPFHWDDRI